MFAVTTATVANPREHALALLGVAEVEGERLAGWLGLAQPRAQQQPSWQVLPAPRVQW